jgi:hypothetical protein
MFETVIDVYDGMFFELGAEVIRIVSSDEATKSVVVERAVLGTAPAAHAAGDPAYAVIVAEHLNSIRDAALQVEKFGGLVGFDDDKSATPEVGETYVATDKKRVYVCIVDGEWDYLGGVTEHSETLVHGDTDDHAQYLTQERIELWHSTVVGEHVTDGDDHDHRYGTGVGRLFPAQRTFIDENTPTADGLIVITYDTEELFASANGVWVPITGAPPGTIAIFLEAALSTFGGACPPGWQRFIDLDGRFPRGATDPATLGQGGISSHSHTYSQVPAHVHSTPEMSVESGDGGHHSHEYAFSTLASGTGMASTPGSAGASYNTGNSGGHTHAVSFPATVTGGATAGVSVVGSASTDVVASLPPYQEVVFCQKL